MITRIDHLKCFGIFQDFSSPTDLKDFAKYNLIYGWNGCGKSTLSKLFACLESKKVHDDFQTCDFKVSTDTQKITNKNLHDSNLNIRVFNQDFIRTNIDWGNRINSILIISEEKIEERKALDKLWEEIKKLNTKSGDLLQDKEHLTKQISQFYSSSASTIKESFKIIDTNDKYYFNYDKRKFESFIAANGALIQKADSILPESSRADLVRSIQPIEKAEIQSYLAPIHTHEIELAYKKLVDVANREIVSKTIERLKENPEINSWVATGLSLHELSQSNVCEFCNQVILESRINELRSHFSDQYVRLNADLAQVEAKIKPLTNIQIALPDSSLFYEELQPKVLELKQELEMEQLELSSILINWLDVLDKKKANPFSKIQFDIRLHKNCLEKLNNIIREIQRCVSEHNEKTTNFAKDLQRRKSRLELHYASKLISESKLGNWKDDLNKIDTNLLTIKTDLTAKNLTAQALETQIIDESIGADRFNKYLHKFLGRSDISLLFDKTEKGYKIVRKNQTIAKNLSEGEKTAIAFVYFVIKIHEKENNIKETIVVVDDPISSFDSNHLFHSYSFLKSACESALQVFVFTHNFQYFRLVRDWFDKKNTFKWIEGVKTEVIKARFFTIETMNEKDRKSIIKNAHDTIQKYNSEYHYIFSKIVSLKENQIDNLDKAYLVANLCRKLLEGFLTFKFPRARNDFRALMNESTNDLELLERVYRFINKYSHNQLVEFHDTPVDNLLGESNSIINDVIDLMKSLDKKHVEEMEEICV